MNRTNKQVKKTKNKKTPEAKKKKKLLDSFLVSHMISSN